MDLQKEILISGDPEPSFLLYITDSDKSRFPDPISSMASQWNECLWNNINITRNETHPMN